jgi:non-lysosomal glucosylceramidase
MVYSHKELYNNNLQRKFGREAQAAAFLLGGIGTGNFSIGSRGELRDWEIFNRPGKGCTLPNTFFFDLDKTRG